MLGVDILILVTLGTQKQPFTRLLDKIEHSNIKDEIVVQAGHTKYTSNKMQIFDFIDYETMENLIKKADIVITHGGTGSIVGPLSKEKKVIALPRLQKYGEHVDNHQTEIIEAFSKMDYILELKEEDDIDRVVADIQKFQPKLYVSNTDNFIEKLKQEIEK